MSQFSERHIGGQVNGGLNIKIVLHHPCESGLAEYIAYFHPDNLCY